MSKTISPAEQQKLEQIVSSHLSTASRAKFTTRGLVDKMVSEVLDWRSKTMKFSQNLQTEDRYDRDMELQGDKKDKDSDDLKRYGKTAIKIFNLMQDGCWRTPNEIMDTLGLKVSPTTITITLRSFREKRYGEHILQKERTGKGMEYRYQLLVNGKNEEFNSFINSQLQSL